MTISNFENRQLSTLFPKERNKLTHEKLSEKLENNGVVGEMLDLLESYPTCQKQRAKDGNLLSLELGLKARFHKVQYWSF